MKTEIREKRYCKNENCHNTLKDNQKSFCSKKCYSEHKNIRKNKISFIIGTIISIIVYIGVAILLFLSVPVLGLIWMVGIIILIIYFFNLKPPDINQQYGGEGYY